MEDSPCLELGLAEHLTLDLSVDLAHILLDVKRNWGTTRSRTHEQLSSRVLVALQLLWSLSKLQVPQLLFLLAFGILLEVLHQVLDLFDLGVSIGVDNLS